MEDEFKSEQRFVSPLIGIFLKLANIWHFGLTISACIVNSVIFFTSLIAFTINSNLQKVV